MAGKDPLHREGDVSSAVLTDEAVLTRDLAQWLEDPEAAAVQDRRLARARLERRTGIPRGIFWAARYRVRESLSAWLDLLIEARVDTLRSEIHELDTTLSTARALGRDDLGPEIAEAQAAVADARARLAAILVRSRGSAS